MFQFNCCLRLRVHSLVGRLRRGSGGGGDDVAGRGSRTGGTLGSLAARCAAACRRRRRIRARVAAWWRNKVVFAVRRAWIAVALRVNSPTATATATDVVDDGGILKLHEDVQMCGYEDVHVMWEMLRRSEMEPLTAKKQHRKRPSWSRLLLSLSSSSSSSSSCFPCSRGTASSSVDE